MDNADFLPSSPDPAPMQNPQGVIPGDVVDTPQTKPTEAGDPDLEAYTGDPVADLVPFIGMVGVVVTTTALRRSYSREQLSRKVLTEFMRAYDELGFPKTKDYPEYDELTGSDRQRVVGVLKNRATLPGMTEMYDEYPRAVYEAAVVISRALASYSGPQ